MERGQFCDEKQFADTSAECEIRLDDVKTATVEQPFGCHAVCQRFTASERDSEFVAQMFISRVVGCLGQRWAKTSS